MIEHHLLKVKVGIEMQKEAEDSYVVTCPQLGCIFVHEESEEAAYRHVREAIEAYLHTSLEHDDPIPEGVVVSHKVVTAPTKTTKIAPAPPVELALTSSYDFAFQH